jgi:nitroreductase
VVTNFFWKSFYKYGDFGYRLSAVDVGIVAARLHRCAVAEFGDASLHFDFIDEAVNAVLRLDSASESAYAAIVLGAHWGGSLYAPQPASGTDNRDVSPPAVRQRSRTIRRSRAFDEMHASVLAGGHGLPPERAVTASLEEQGAVEPARLVPLSTALQGVLDDLPAAVFARTSNGELFTGAGVRAEILSTVLGEAARSIAHAHAAAGGGDLPRPVVRLIAQRVAGVPAGSYCYDDRTGQLILRRRGDLGLQLMACSNICNINLDLSAFTVHIADILDFRHSRRGNRTYRIQQMLVGAALDGIMLACSALGLGCHPMLGFNAAAVDSLYDLQDAPVGTLAQICVGVARLGYHLEGSIGS